MTLAAYDLVAAWYDGYLSNNPLYQNVVLPTLWKLTGEIAGQSVCDLACGQGWIARELARRGAQVSGFDISKQMLSIARRYEEQEPLGISYTQSDIQQAEHFPVESFEGCVCILALMDIPDLAAVFQTIRRVLKPGGWLILAITHPCFELPLAQWITLEDGSAARTVQGYFREGFWTSERGGVRSRVGAHHRTLSSYLNTLSASGFCLEKMIEPGAMGEQASQVTVEKEIPALMFLRARAI